MTKTHAFVRTEARRAVTRHSPLREADGVFRQRSANSFLLEELFPELPEAEFEEGLSEEMRLQAQLEVAHIARRLAKKHRLRIVLEEVEKNIERLGRAIRPELVVQWEDGPLPRDIYDSIEDNARN